MNKIKNMLPPTTQRVALHTDINSNNKIRNNTINCLSNYKSGNSELISEKIKKLNNEWDTERYIEAKAGFMILFSSILGLKLSRYWFIVTGTIAYFLLQHAIMGWCPTLCIIRKLGVRTAEEINNEKVVLKMIRKDFQQQNNTIPEMLAIAEKQ